MSTTSEKDEAAPDVIGTVRVVTGMEAAIKRARETELLRDRHRGIVNREVGRLWHHHGHHLLPKSPTAAPRQAA